MTNIGAREATLAGIPGRGHLELMTKGYTRLEGPFFVPLSARDEIVKLVRSSGSIEFEGAVDQGRGSIAIERRRVYVRGFETEPMRIRVMLTGFDVPQAR